MSLQAGANNAPPPPTPSPPLVAGANNALPEEGLLKKSKQMKSDGTRYAPWMVCHCPAHHT